MGSDKMVSDFQVQLTPPISPERSVNGISHQRVFKKITIELGVCAVKMNELSFFQFYNSVGRKFVAVTREVFDEWLIEMSPDRRRR